MLRREESLWVKSESNLRPRILTAMLQFSSVTQSCLTLCDPWTAACQVSLSITNSQSLLKLKSIELVMHPTISSSVILFSSCLQSFPASGSFQMSKFFALGGQSIGVSPSTSVFQMNIQDWFALGWTGWMSLQSKRCSRILLSKVVEKAMASHSSTLA